MQEASSSEVVSPLGFFTFERRSEVVELRYAEMQYLGKMLGYVGVFYDPIAEGIRDFL